MLCFLGKVEGVSRGIAVYIFLVENKGKYKLLIFAKKNRNKQLKLSDEMAAYLEKHEIFMREKINTNRIYLLHLFVLHNK